MFVVVVVVVVAVVVVVVLSVRDSYVKRRKMYINYATSAFEQT